MSPPPPAEAARRRPGFAGGVPVVLCDGEAWWLAAPDLAAVGSAFDRLLDAFVEAETAAAAAVALADLAFAMLARNYEIDFDETRHLLCVYPAGDPRRPANDVMWGEVADVALGIATRSYSRWVRATLLACNVPLPLPRDVARDVVELLVATGRATPPAAWVARMTREAVEARTRALPHNRI